MLGLSVVATAGLAKRVKILESISLRDTYIFEYILKKDIT